MIPAEEAYNKHLPEFSAIPEEKTKTPNMARDDVIGEAEELNIVGLEDEEALVKASCPREYIKTLDERIGAYSHASSVWENSEFSKSDARKQWLEIEGHAYDIKEELLHDLLHALRNNPDQLKYLKKITAGHGRRDLVMDFKDAAVIGRNNIDALQAIHFAPKRLDDAEKMHEKLSNLLAESSMSPSELEELKKAAYQAYTYLQEAVAEIRVNGQHVFWKDPERLDLYKSDHYQKLRKSRKKEEQSETVSETTE